MLVRRLLTFTVGALLLTSLGAQAQDSAATAKAQDGIGGYMSIVALTKLCNLSLDPPVMEVVVGNINALQPIAKMTDQQLDAVLEGLLKTFTPEKTKYCGGGLAGLNAIATEVASNAMAGSQGSGASLRALTGAPTLLTGSDVDGIFAVAKKYSDATLSKDSQGDPIIKGKTKGVNWSLLFYGCEKNAACTSVQFYYGFEASPKPNMARVNQWNEGKRFARAYIDKDGDPNITYDVELKNGVSLANFDASVSRWVDLMSDFKSFVTSKK